MKILMHSFIGMFGLIVMGAAMTIIREFLIGSVILFFIGWFTTMYCLTMIGCEVRNSA